MSEIIYKVCNHGELVGYWVNTENGEDYISIENYSGKSAHTITDIASVEMDDIVRGNFNRAETTRESVDMMKSMDLVEGATSKGNQLKWYDKSSNLWYKEDFLGYEGKAEWVASKILKCSNLNISEYATYKPAKILYKGEIRTGCSSENFLKRGESIVTFAKLFEKYRFDYEKFLYKNLSTEERIMKTIFKVKELTGLDVTDYLRKTLTLDAIILNEDRHFNNLAIIYEEECRTFKLCPIFDNGMSLLSDTKNYPTYRSVIANVRKVKAKPFSTDFKKQLDVLGIGFKVNKYKLREFLANNKEELGRISNVVWLGLDTYSNVIDRGENNV